MTVDSPRDLFLAAIRGQPTRRPAVATVDQSGTYEQMSALGVSWPNAHQNAHDMARLASGAHMLLGFDAVKAPFCQTVEQEALGCTVDLGGDINLPSIIRHPYDPALGPVEAPVFPEDFLRRGRIPATVEAIRLLKNWVGRHAAVIGGVIGPFSIAAALVGIKECMKCSVRNPDRLRPYLEVATRAGIEMAKALHAAGADVICIEDMMASATMISPKTYRELALPYEIELIGTIKAPTVLHVCGNVDFILADMIRSGATAISFEPLTNIDLARQAADDAGRSVGLIGGIDAMRHLYFGTPEDVRNAAHAAVGKGYSVIAPGCSIPPGTSTANLLAMQEAVAGGGAEAYAISEIAY
jgi:[methyl-Co(III) methanol-specific corrinoid protein]:coenzyme M methyltransferase